ncbi:predicted protein [Naegleria gruberi]|uniref:Elongation factor Ts, mitochondrial n=1 Tax=Naegleria gruberi TaxID=5762 RepID=D2V0W2_NAEGR|nr:uncharacterized protein NAEGRDRAFT_62436 [Naegleria gruberi]EFC49800.1 predicted protein [Naegleria gruberi]|eukprot:XP_002682544.1 predicted protein [Naegleria gruberi strain NEG-M]
MMKRICSRVPSVLCGKQNMMICNGVTTTRSMFTCTNFLRAPPTELIKQLRAETDAPLGQVRKALEESDNDIKKAKEWLRQKGLQTAAKKSARSTQEGIIGIQQNGNERGVLFEVNSETDFVINSDVFKGVVDECLDVLVKSKFEKNEYSVEQDEQSFNQQVAENSALFENGVSIKQKFTELVAVLRENVKARRVKFINNIDSSSQLVGYLHNSKTSKIGGVGAFVIVKAAPNSTKTAEQLQSAGRQIAMHICGMGPNYLTKDQVPAEVLSHERELLIKRLEEQNMEEKKKAEEAGKEYKPKPQNILNMMIEGQLNKQFLADHVLLLQPWVLDQKMSVQQFLKEEGIEVVDFIRMKVGEGMAYQAKKSFAEEVAEQVGQK